MIILSHRQRLLSDDGVSTYTQPAVGQCERCGHDVELEHPLSNPCACGAEYNMSGQRLRDNWVQEWAEETGELESDIFSEYDPEEVG